MESKFLAGAPVLPSSGGKFVPMESNFLRASLVFVWQGATDKMVLPPPDEIFGGEGVMEMGPEGPILRGKQTESGRSDEIILGPARMTIGSDVPTRVLEIFLKIADFFEGATLVAAGYNVEYEWFPLDENAPVWLTTRFIQPSVYLKTDIPLTFCTDITFHYGDQENKVVSVSLQPRILNAKRIFCHVNCHMGKNLAPAKDIAEGFEPFVKLDAMQAMSYFVEGNL